jgi:hypothetical protein
MQKKFYFRSLKVCLVIVAFFANFTVFANESSKPTAVGPGTYSVGPGSPTYTTTITAAITSINAAGGITGPIVLELNAAYTTTTETLSAITGASATNTITIRPALGVTKTITNSASNGPTLSILGGKNYIIDGQAGGVGGTKDLTIVNTNTGLLANAVRFQNEGSNNIVKNCILKSQNTSTTNAVVLFGTTTGASGNDNNEVSNCDITSVGPAALSTNGVYSAGTSGKTNDANKISNCNIYDIFNAGAKSVGILMAANTTTFTISGNSFYQTTARTSSAVWEAIELNNKTAGGNGF